MKNKTIKILLTIAILTCATGTVVHASGSEVTLTDLNVGAAAILESGTGQSSGEGAETTDADADSTGAVGNAADEVMVSAGAAFVTDVVPQGLELTADEETEDEASDSEEESVGGAYGYTNLGIARVEDHLNVRETADDNSKIVGKMSNDSGCEILEIVGNKAHIVSGSVEGYVSTDYLLTGDGAFAYAKQIVKKLATVSADGLKVRSTPSLDGPVVNLVAYGEELEVVEELDGWVKVLYDDEEAYVSADYVTVGENLKTALNMTEFLYGAGVSDVRVELCEYAKQFLGNPYVWGGTSLTKGADCSGFVLSVYAKYGISLPHSSRAQANMGTAISMSEAKPGDLVFYSKGGRINHVAIYIGGGQVIHASSPKTGIRITSAYYRTPTAVRRLIQD